MQSSSKMFTFPLCAENEIGEPAIPLDYFHSLSPIDNQPLEWAEPTDRGDDRPRVIDNGLIQKMYKKYSELPSAHKDLAEAEISFCDMEELNLEYLNIFHIENLEKCCNLKVLCLSNNIIETPVSLGSLIHLEQLDLSYNKLTCLNSIHLLKKLRVLRLNNNLLTSVELLKYNHRCLEILNLGYNKLSNFLETLLYLSSLNNLKSLSLDGNPFWGDNKTTNTDLKMLLFHCLPNLRFYEHRIVTSSDCYPKACEQDDFMLDHEARKMTIIRRVIENFQRDDPGLMKRLDTIRNEIIGLDENEDKARKKLALESTLDQLCLAGLRYGKGFVALMERDNEGQQLIALGNKVKHEIFGRLEEAMEPVIVDITQRGIEFYRKRQECINKYVELWESDDEIHQNVYKGTVDDYEARKQTIQESLLAAFNADNSREELAAKNMKDVLLHDKEFVILTKKLWWDLMTEEMAAHAKFEDMFEVLDEELTEMTRVYIEPFHEKVVRLRKVEEEFFEYLMDSMSQYASEMLNKPSARAKLNEEQKKMLFSSEVRNSVMTQSHDNHTNFIDIEEENVVDLLNKWQVTAVEECRKIEIENNREEVDGLQSLVLKYKASWEADVGEAIKTAYTYLWVVDPKWAKEMMHFKMNVEDRKIFDELESTIRKQTYLAIEARGLLEKTKEIAAAKENARLAELNRKMHMKRLKSLVEEQDESPPPVTKGYKSDKRREQRAMNELALLEQMETTYETLRDVVLAGDSFKRDAVRMKKEHEWKEQGDVERVVHSVGGTNLKVYQRLKEVILNSDTEDSS